MLDHLRTHFPPHPFVKASRGHLPLWRFWQALKHQASSYEAMRLWSSRATHQTITLWIEPVLAWGREARCNELRRTSSQRHFQAKTSAPPKMAQAMVEGDKNKQNELQPLSCIWCGLQLRLKRGLDLVEDWEKSMQSSALLFSSRLVSVKNWITRTDPGNPGCNQKTSSRNTIELGHTLARNVKQDLLR